MYTTDVLIAGNTAHFTPDGKYTRLNIAQSAEEAIDLFFRNHYDAIILPTTLSEVDKTKLLKVFAYADDDTIIIEQRAEISIEQLTNNIIARIKEARKTDVEIKDNALANAAFNINIIS